MNPWEEDWSGAQPKMPWEEDWAAPTAVARAGQRGGMVTEGTISRDDYMAQRGGVGFGGRAVAQDVGAAPNGPIATYADEGLLGKKPVLDKSVILDRDFRGRTGAGTLAALETPQDLGVDKMSRAQSVALGVNDFNPARLLTGDRGYEAALTESVQDNPFSTRAGQTLALTSGGGAQLTNRAILAAPKLVPAAIAARVAGKSVPARLARYGARLTTLAGLGAADYYAYNAAAEAPNQAREQGKPLPGIGERMDFANERIADPAGWAPLPVASLLYRGARGAFTAGKNTAQATLAANKAAPKPEVATAGAGSLPPVQWRGGSFTPTDVQARVAMGGIDPSTNASVREIAIDKLLKEGFNPDEAEKAVRLLSYNGYSDVNEMLFEIDNNLGEIATAVGRVNRPGQQVLRDEFKARREAMPEEVRTALRGAVGASGDDLETFALKMTEAATEASADGYRAAYGKQVSDDAWQRILGLFGETPDAVDAARKGAELARNSARRDPAKLEAARQLDELAGVLGSGGVPNAKLSTMALDFLDRGLGRKVSVATRAGDNAYSSSLLDFRNALRGSGLDAETGLNAPRTIYAQYKAAQRAVEFGEKSFGKSTSLKDMKAQFVAAMKSADEAAEEGIGEGSGIIDNALMMGWVRGAENAIDMAENPATLIRQLYGSKRQRDKLVSMLRELPDEAPSGIKADTTKVKKALVGSVKPDYTFDFALSTGERAQGKTSVRSLFDRQRDMIESERRTVGGSPTAGASDAIANQGGDQRRLAGALDMLRAPQEIPWKIAAAVAERITQPMIYNPAISRELGELLATRGRDRLLSVISEIRARQTATGRGPKPPAGAPPAGTPPKGGGFAAARAAGKVSPEERAVLLGNPDDPLPPVKGMGFDLSRPQVTTRKTRSEAFSDDRLTDTQNKAVEMRRNGFSNREIADELDMDESGVRGAIWRAKERGVDVGPPTRERLLDDVLYLKSQGLSNAQIAQRVGSTAGSVAAMVSRAGKTRSNGLSLPEGLRDELGRGAAGAFAGGVAPLPSSGDWKEDARNRLLAIVGGAGVAVASPRIAASAGRRTVGKTATAGVPGGFGKGGRKSKAPNPDAIRDSVRKVAEGIKAKGIEAKPQPPEMRVGKGVSKLMGIKDNPAMSMKVATDMLKAGRSPDEIWEATSRLPIKIEGRTILVRGQGSTPEDVQAAFWQEMAKPYSKRATWAQKSTEGMFPVGPNSIARKPLDERLKTVASRVARAPADARFRKDIWEETGVVVIGRDGSGQMVTRSNKPGADFEPVALMDGKEFKTFDEAISYLEGITKLRRADQPDWYRKNFSEVMDTASLRQVGKGEYAARRTGDEILKRPRVVGLTAGGAIGAGAVIAADAEMKRR